MASKNVEDLFFKLLETIKKEEPRNSKVASDVVKMIKRHCKGKGNGLRIQSIMKAKRDVQLPLGEGSSWSDWNGPSPFKSTKKKQNQVVVDKPEPVDTEQLDLEEIANLNAQGILDHFGTLAKVKEFAKNLGLEMAPELESMDYIHEFKEKLTNAALALLDDESEDDETPENPGGSEDDLL